MKKAANLNSSEDVNFILGKQSLRESILYATYWLEVQQSKLENLVSKTRKQDRELFNKCLSAQMAKDFTKAEIYANECAKVRKIGDIILKNRIALEQLMLKLEAIREIKAL